MELTKSNDKIQINEFGFKLEINPASLLNSMISVETRNCLEKLIKNHLNELLIQFKDVEKSAQVNKPMVISYLRETKIHPAIKEYANLSRELSSLLPDLFEEFYNENEDTLSFIGQIYRYNRNYGFNDVKTIKL